MEKEQQIVFKNSFTRNYWKTAVSELKSVRSLVLCALFTALRIAVKGLKIPIAPPYVYFSFDFLINALGATIYGPVLALLGGAASDTIGAVLFPTGAYYLPFVLVEMSSAFIFALFLYKKPLTSMRILLSRLSVVTFCNLILNPIIMYYYYIWQGTAKAFDIINLTRLIKNVALLPFESLVLIAFLRAVAVPLAKYTNVLPEKSTLKIGWREWVILSLFTVIAVVAIVLYVMYKKGTLIF